MKKKNYSKIRSKLIEKGNCFFQNPDREIYILGTNKYGINVARFLKRRNIKVTGLINENLEISTFEGYRIFKSSHDYSNASIINCIVEGRTIDAEDFIDMCKPKSRIDYFCLKVAFPDELIEVDFLDDTDSILDYFQNYCELYNLLGDEQSKTEFKQIIGFRITRDIEFLKIFPFRIDEQYFEQFYDLGENPVFIDGGGYDGNTSLKFSKLYPNYKKIYFFEPLEQKFDESTKLLKDIENISFYNKGLWEKNEFLRFDDSLGSASKISPDGSKILELVSIDQTINDKVNLLKLDIEGSEYSAIKGAKNLIMKYKPIIAVCVYHNQMDFIQIPELIISYNKDYRIFFRHYSQGVFESVMYFI